MFSRTIGHSPNLSRQKPLVAQDLLVKFAGTKVRKVLIALPTNSYSKHMITPSITTGPLLGFTLLAMFAPNSRAAIYNISDINALFTVPVYSENFDSTTNANWAVAQSTNGPSAPDSTVNFGYNYTAGGNVGPFTGVPVIPSAPSLGGTSTRGVLLSAQDVDDPAATDLAQGIAIFAQNLPAAPTVPYAIRFDLWANYISGTGSSEFVFWGAGATGSQTSIGTITTGGTGTGTPPPPGGTGTAGVGPVTTGITTTITADGGFGRDLRLYNGTAEEIVDNSFLNKSTIDINGNLAIAAQDAGLPAYSPAFGQTAGVNIVPGNRWLDITLVYDGIDLTSYVNGQAIWSKATGTFTLGKSFLGYMDANSSVSAASLQTFGLIDNFRIVAVPEPTSGLLGLISGLCLLCRRNRNSAG